MKKMRNDIKLITGLSNQTQGADDQTGEGGETVKRHISGELIFPDGVPTRTAQQKGVRGRYDKETGKYRIHHYTKKEVSDDLMKLKAQLIGLKPEKPLEGPLRLSIDWWFPVKDKKLRGRLKASRPDLDNLEKGFTDLLGKMEFFEDDGQIAEMRLRKRYVEPGRGKIMLILSELSEEEYLT